MPNRIMGIGGTVLLAAVLAGCGGSPLTAGIPTWTPRAASAKPAAAPANAAPAPKPARPFTCPHEKQVRAVTAKDYTARPEDSGGAVCAYDLLLAPDKPGTGYVILHPPYSPGKTPETLIDYRRDLEKFAQVEDAPEFGPDAFVADDRTMFCAVWMPATDRQIASVQFNNFTAEQIDRCDYAKRVARLLL